MEQRFQKLKEEQEEFVPYMNERSKMGRITIKSVADLVTKQGDKSLIRRVTDRGK